MNGRICSLLVAGLAFVGCDAQEERDVNAQRVVLSTPGLGETVRCLADRPDSLWVFDARDSAAVRVRESQNGPFYQVTAALMADTDLFVVHAGGHELVRYERGGKLLDQLGGEGAGPGEFAFPSGLDTYRGDSLVVFDSGLGRITVVSRDLQLGRVVDVGRGIPNPRFVGSLASGHFVVRGTYLYFGKPATRDTAFAVLYSPAGVALDTLKSFPHTTSYTAPFGEGVRRGQVPFGARAWYATGENGVVMGAADRPQLWLWTPDGADSPGKATLPCERTALDGDVVEGYMRDRIDRAPAGQRNATQGFVEQIPFGDSLPFYERLLVDARGQIWLGGYSRARSGPRDWLVLTREAKVVGRARIPDDFYLLQVTEDDLVGVERDELDGESVVVYSLQKD